MPQDFALQQGALRVELTKVLQRSTRNPADSEQKCQRIPFPGINDARSNTVLQHGRSPTQRRARADARRIAGRVAAGVNTATPVTHSVHVDHLHRPSRAGGARVQHDMTNAANASAPIVRALCERVNRQRQQSLERRLAALGRGARGDGRGNARRPIPRPMVPDRVRLALQLAPAFLLACLRHDTIPLSAATPSPTRSDLWMGRASTDTRGDNRYYWSTAMDVWLSSLEATAL